MPTESSKLRFPRGGARNNGHSKDLKRLPRPPGRRNGSQRGREVDITERHKMEELLRNSEYQYRQLFLGLSVALYTTDIHGRLTQYNEAAVALWGRSPEIGKESWCGSWRIYRPDGTALPFEECPMAVTLRERRPMRGQEIVVERPDGVKRNVLPHPDLIRNASGEVIGAINMLMDITDIKQVEIDSQRLAAIVRSSDDAIISKDLNGTINSWNEGAARIFGYTAEEVIGKPITILIPAEHQDEEPRILERIRRGEHIDHYETVRRRKDGSLVELSLSVSPVKDAHGKVIGAAKIARDITERKEAEQKVAESATREKLALDDAEATRVQFRSLFESAPGLYLVMTADENLSVVAVSDAYLRATMTARDAILNRNFFDIFPNELTDRAPDAILDLRASLRRVRQSRNIDVMGVQRYPIRKPKEAGGGFEERYWSPINSPVLGANGELAYIIHRIEDVTEYVRLKQKNGNGTPEDAGIETRTQRIEAEIIQRGQELSRANEELRHAHELLARQTSELEEEVLRRTWTLSDTIKSLESVCYTIAHDLRGPLRSMAGFSQLLLDDYATRLDENGKDYARRIVKSAVQLDQLIQDLLEYGKLSQDELPRSNVSLGACLNTVLGQLAAEIAERSAEVEVKRPLPSVRGYAPVLQQVLANLIGNALKFVRPGVSPVVRIWAEEKENTVRFWVEDDGIGISTEHHTHIFGLFKRLTDAYPGTGIGLAIVRKGMERMGGRAGVESEEGKGSRFWIELPKAN
jgi:PAS domain S-box-containing protein